jgi:type IV secretory pathway TrbD component
MTLNIPSHLAFRAWPKFQPVIQIPAPPAHRVLARRWRMHGGRAAIVLSSSALAVTLLIGLTLIWPLFGAPVSAAPTAAAVLPAIKPPTASPTFTRPPATLTRPNATATPAISATPDLPATLQAAVAATLTAQPTPVAPTTAAQPAPAATAAASPLPSPTSFVNQGPLTGASGLLFDETFKPGGYWDVGETPYAVREISDGRFSITMKTVGAISWSLNGVSGDDFYVQAATSSDGCRAGDYYGLVFRARDDSNFYLFGISCDGRYRVLCQKDGEFAPLIDFKFSPAVAVNGGYNLLGVRAVKDQFSFYVNDDFLASTNDATFAQGRFGVFAKSFETGNLTIRFDDITAWSIKP